LHSKFKSPIKTDSENTNKKAYDTGLIEGG